MLRNHLAVGLSLAALVAGPALAQDDLVADGEKVFKRCAACHQVGEGAENRVGPELNGVIGRTAGTLEGFATPPPWSRPAKAGWSGTTRRCTTYLENPREMVKGTKMAFAGLKKPEDIAAVIAYIEANGGAGS